MTPTRSATIIRPATLDDARAIAGIHVRSWRAAYRGLVPAELLASLSVERREAMWRTAVGSPDIAVLVADRDGAVVGFVEVGATHDLEGDPSTTGEVMAIYVDPDVYGQGAGRSLMEGAVDELGRRGFVRATLWVFTANDRARRFYERVGWRPDGATKIDQYGDAHLHEVRYAREIEAEPEAGADNS
jgi:ribosomal protein S18 acetylase RimI-like enzyme